ncbi:transcriptional regulator, AraC family [Cellulophaga algicola DSM 14237]|uniref:Transcriptional regulator, AraC family n=1 Tax=Cellulophaga algicola (strain DSM 14237 / IC166 / ACAM 630) TaxID=688270 RepID=E6X621_CELAD|nr:helix-turn-helix transcriptional regulator [Cellulophaga algicola]ADV50580.1 transcriptional regulator, AraC family [Cellulophaga algicola DSM 14237]
MIYITLLNIAIFQGIILSIIILKSPLFKGVANKYLAYAIFTLSLLLLNLVFEITEAYNTIPLLRFFDDIEWAFIFPVFIFLFVVNKVNHPIKNSKKLWWMFLPIGYSAIIGIINDLDVVAGIYDIPNSGIRLFEVLYQIELFLAVIFIPAILIYTYSFIKFSKEKQEKQLLTFLWSIVFTLLFSWVIAIIVFLFLQYDISFFMKIIALFATFLIHWTAYIGIYKYKLAKDKAGINTLLNNDFLVPYNNVPTDIPNKKNDKKEAFTIDNPYYKKLEVLCKSHQIYRDNTLSREKIAIKLGISAGYVSQLVNSITEGNFTNYINRYRVEAVKKMISDSKFENYSLLAIGLESGFTSKTTFYKAFKKITGMTPKEYRKSQK